MRELLILLLCLTASIGEARALPEGFVYVDEAVPDLVVDLRYHSSAFRQFRRGRRAQ